MRPAGGARRASRVALAAAAAAAATVALAAASLAFELRAEVDRDTAPVGGQIVLRLTVSGAGQEIPRLRIPAPDGFDMYSAGTSQSISLVNGRVESSLTESYVLVPRAEGTYTLGPFELSHKGETRRTDPIAVRVTAADRPPAPAPPGARGPARPGARAGRPKNYFVRASVDKTEAYVGEPVTLTFRFYSRVRLAQDPEYTPPAATGFWVEDLPPVRRYYEDVDGLRYLVNEVKTALFPTAAGDHTIGPATLKVVGAVGDPLRLDPFQMFGADPFALLREGEPEVLRSEPIRVRVKSLPAAGRPPEFSGLVGEYSLSARLDKSTVAANEPVTLALVLAGDGNLETAPEPALALPPSVRSYDSGSRVNTSKEGYRVRGEKVVEKVLIPQVAGDLVIPPATVATFDPRSGRYRRLETDTLRVRVLPAAAAVASAGAGREVRAMGRDLRPVRDGERVLESPGPWLYQRPVFWVAQAVPLLLFLGARRAARARRALDADVSLSRARRARGVARKRLREARAALGDGASDRFFTLLGRSLADYAADRLGVSRHGIAREDLLATMAARAVPGDLVEEMGSLLERCDMGRFAPGGNVLEARGDLLRRGEEAILGLEKLLGG